MEFLPAYTSERAVKYREERKFESLNGFPVGDDIDGLCNGQEIHGWKKKFSLIVQGICKYLQHKFPSKSRFDMLLHPLSLLCVYLLLGKLTRHYALQEIRQKLQQTFSQVLQNSCIFSSQIKNFLTISFSHYGKMRETKVSGKIGNFVVLPGSWKLCSM